jgi:hypothetical protein
MKKETLDSSITLMTTYEFTRRDIPDNRNISIINTLNLSVQFFRASGAWVFRYCRSSTLFEPGWLQELA